VSGDQTAWAVPQSARVAGLERGRDYRGCMAQVRCVTRDDGSERSGPCATLDASTPSNRRVPAPNGTGDGVIEHAVDQARVQVLQDRRTTAGNADVAVTGCLAGGWAC